MRISHPRPALGRQKFIGVDFIDGVTEVEGLHPEVQASLLQHGFTIEVDAAAQRLEDLSVPELRDLAKNDDIDLGDARRKADIIAAIEAAPTLRVITDGGIFEVGAIVKLTREGIELVGGDEESRAEVQEIVENGSAARVVWLTPSESSETVISLSIIELAPED